MEQTQKLFSQKPSSYWRNSTDMPTYSALEKDLDTDVLVIGAGIAGITTAYELTKRGRSVVLIEGREIISGTTGYTTSKLTAQHDIIYQGLIERYGEETAKKYFQANLRAINYVKDTAAEHGIDCEFEEQEAYIYTQLDEGVETIEKEVEAYRKLQIDGYLADTMPLDIPIKAAAVMRQQAQFHPVKYLVGLLKEIELRGGSIYEQTLAVSFDTESRPVVQTENGHTITANHVVSATHFPVQVENQYFSSNMNPKNSYGIAIKSKKPYPDGMYISLESPKRSIRSLRKGDDHYVLVGGESHVTGDGSSILDRYERIYQFAEEQFGVEELYEHWSSHDLLTTDQLPFVGKVSDDAPGIFTATGFGKWGLSNGVAAASLLADLIEGKDNEFADVFKIGREMEEAEAVSIGEDDVNRISNEAVLKPDDLPIGKGAILEKKGQTMAYYRDEQGELHEMSASCTHNGCPVSWNDADHTWDCSCHGSRFTAVGEVVEGPALRALDRD
ncbi:FAD-dependent oxidoreductase [Terribacillus saccharophilus]|uniref:FAD-dependent oxidoreductase n=1 Tax=Terribacillus saccharophilus TaxID=361277 RepID=UPI003981C179